MKPIQFTTIFIIAILANAMQLTGQNLDYEDDIYPLVKNQPKEITYPILFNFQKEEGHHCNAYFQLGLIFKEWAMEYDPFTNYDNVTYFMNQAETYFGLCSNKMDKREARKHGELYQGAKKQEDNWWHKPEDIKEVIDKHLSTLKDYKQNVIEMKKYLSKSEEKYNKCIKIFRNINARYTKIKDIYLNADENFFNKAEELKTSFDSTIYFFEKYRKILDEHPVKDYDQEYSLAEINTYHLQGITDANFLANDIVLWDYKTWVENLREVVSTDINELREKIKTANKEMEDTLETLKNDNLNEPIPPYSLERKLALMINKFDYQSIMLDLFHYKASKINLFSKKHSEKNNPNLTIEPDNFKNKSLYYSNISEQKKQTDSLLNQFKNKLSKDEYNKYKPFFSTNHGDIEKVKEYVDNQANENNKFMDDVYKNLICSFINKEQSEIADTILTYRRKKMNLFHYTPNTSEVNFDYRTTSIKPHKNYYYLSGFLKNNQSEKAFLAKIDTSLDILWVKEFADNSGNNSRALQFEISENNVVALMYSYNTDNSNEVNSSNSIYKFDHDGNLLDNKKLGYKQIPQYFRYDDLNQTYLMAFQGMKNDTVSDKSSKMDTLNIVRTNTELDSTLWENQFTYKGELVDIVKMDLDYLVFCNYQSYESTSGKINKNQLETDSPSAALAFHINEKGNIGKVENYEHSNPFFLVNAEKLSSEKINLQGIESEYFNVLKKEPETISEQYDIYYSIINKKGENVLKVE
ncbi:MAG: hypothetical protein ACQESJ_02655 [Bacteroidota bacterium]